MGILISTGSRASAICALSLSDINFNALSVTFRKTKRNKEYVSFITPTIAADIMAYVKHERPTELGENDPLFVGERKIDGEWRQLSRQAITNISNAYSLNATGRALSAHKMRHTAASIMLEGGVPLDEIQDSLNHASLETTRIYAKRFSVESRRESTQRAFAAIG